MKTVKWERGKEVVLWKMHVILVRKLHEVFKILESRDTPNKFEQNRTEMGAKIHEIPIKRRHGTEAESMNSMPVPCWFHTRSGAHTACRGQYRWAGRWSWRRLAWNVNSRVQGAAARGRLAQLISRLARVAMESDELCVARAAPPPRRLAAPHGTPASLA